MKAPNTSTSAASEAVGQDLPVTDVRSRVVQKADCHFNRIAAALRSLRTPTTSRFRGADQRNIRMPLDSEGKRPGKSC